jgi:hypothetical protein
MAEGHSWQSGSVGTESPTARVGEGEVGTPGDGKLGQRVGRLEDAPELGEVGVHSMFDGTRHERAEQGGPTVRLQYCVELNDRLAIRRGEPVAVAEWSGSRRRTGAELGGVLAGEDLEFVLDAPGR